MLLAALGISAPLLRSPARSPPRGPSCHWTSEIRQNCPDTIPFLTSSDLLYVHSEFDSELKGTLVLSTYPLFSISQVWTWPFTGRQRRIQFPSGDAEGIYNAVLAALGDEASMEDYADPLSTDSQSPPLWLSVVGNDGLWPVGFIHASTGRVFERSSSAVLGTLPISLGFNLYPRAFEIAFLLAVLVCLLPAPMLLRRFPVSRGGAGRLDRISPPSPHGSRCS
ncbi:MAG: hypothetical protein ACREQN_06340 [Candidatus Binataceae bacterium]